MYLPRDNSIDLGNGALFYSCERHLLSALEMVRADKSVGLIEQATPERLVALRRQAMILFYMDITSVWCQ